MKLFYTGTFERLLELGFVKNNGVAERYELTPPNARRSQIVIYQNDKSVRFEPNYIALYCLFKMHDLGLLEFADTNYNRQNVKIAEIIKIVDKKNADKIRKRYGFSEKRWLEK